MDKTAICANPDCGIEFELSRTQSARRKWGANKFYHTNACWRPNYNFTIKTDKKKNFYPYE